MPRFLRRLASSRRWLALLLICILSFGYVSLAAGVRLSRVVLPGNPLTLPEHVSTLPGLSAPTPEPGQRINIMILGIDRRPGTSFDQKGVLSSGNDPGRSDTMAVLSIDPGTKSATVLSIPRDLWLEVPDGHGGWTWGRINEAYYTGENLRLPGRGPVAAETAIYHNFGIKIDQYVVIDFWGFMQLIDALGGINLDVPKSLTATVLPRGDTGGYEYTYFAGWQHLNGELALAYARFRNDPEGDFGRIRRQQAVALAARERAISLDWLGHSLSLWDKYNTTVQTDVPAYKIPGFALLARQIEAQGIRARSLGEAGATSEVILPDSGADVLFPHPTAIARIIGDAFADPALQFAALQRLSRLYPSDDVTPTPQPLEEPAPATPPQGLPGRGSVPARQPDRRLPTP